MESPNRTEFSLHLSGGRSIALGEGAVLTERELPGLRAEPPGDAVASVVPHPTDPSIIGLQNRSQLTWRAHLASGDKEVIVPPAKSVRLAAGTLIRFGTLEGVVEGGPAIADGGRKGGRRRGLRVLLAVAGLGLVVLGGWLLFKDGTQPPKDEPDVHAVKPVVKPVPSPIAGPVVEPAGTEQARTVYLPPLVQGYAGVYALQWAIDFDTLDGAVIDPATGGLSLFGHSSEPNHVLVIPYLDYLATALECGSPHFSLRWTKESYPEMDRFQQAAGRAILEAVAKMFDEKQALTAAAAWFLRQNGVPVIEGTTYAETLRWMLKAAGRPQTAEVMRLLGALEHGSAGSGDLLSLCEALRLAADYRKIDRQRTEGRLSDEQFWDQFAPGLLAALGREIGAGNRGYADRYRQSRAGGAPPSAAIRNVLQGLDADVSALMRENLVQLAGGQAETPVPASLVARLAGTRVPVVRPEFDGLPASSLLAHLAFQADVAGKFLLSTPELRLFVPGYRTQFAFQRDKGRFSHSGHERVWFSPGRFELTQTRDSRMVRITRSEMAINIRKTDPHTRTDLPDPLAEEYGRELTSQYDALTRAIPVLHVLREAEKVMALAKWIRQRGHPFRLPNECRQTWNPPQEYPGVVHFTLWVNSAGAVVMSSAAEGGVNLDPKPIVREVEKDTPSDRQIRVPEEASLDRAERELRKGLEAATSANDRATENLLKRELASILCEKAQQLWRSGDKEGSIRALNEAMGFDPSTPAVQAVWRVWNGKEPAGPGESGAGRPNVGVVVPAITGLEPFDWDKRTNGPGTPETDRVKGETTFAKALGKPVTPIQPRERVLPLLPLPENPKKQAEALKAIERYLESQPEFKKQVDDLGVLGQKMASAAPGDPQAAALVNEYQQKLKEVEEEMEKHKDKLIQVIGSIEE